MQLVAPDDGEEMPDTDMTDLDLLYAPVEGLEGEELRGVLYEIAALGHSRLSYADLWGALDFTDEDPDNADHVILLDTGRSHPKTDRSAPCSTRITTIPGIASTSGQCRMASRAKDSSRTPTFITFARPTSPATPTAATSTSTGASSRTPIALPGAMPTASSRAMR
jgi:hypothetical protein